MKVLILFLFLVVTGAKLAPAQDSADAADPAPPPPAASNGSIISTRQTTTLAQTDQKEGIRWRPVLQQAAMFFAISEGFRIGTQEDTRESLKGPYFKDYITSLRGLGGWNDDDPPIANYVAHPMNGSTNMWFVVHNDPNGDHEVFGIKNRAYWISRLKGMGFAAAYSTFYEIGPIGDAAVGNLGMNPNYKGAVDLVVTPTVGMGWHLTEDVIDKYFIRWVEKKTGNVVINTLTRTWLNPTRSFANLLRFSEPWRRDTRGGVLAIRTEHQSGVIAHSR